MFVEQADGTFLRTAKTTGNAAGRDVPAGDFEGGGRGDSNSLKRASRGSVSVLYNAALLSGL